MESIKRLGHNMNSLFLQPDDFATYISSQPEEEQVKGATRLLTELQKIPNLNTRANYLSRYRKRLSAQAPDHPILRKLCFPKDFWDERKQKLSGVLDTTLNNARFLTDVDGMLALADQLLDSKNVYEKMIGLGLATGRRCIEVATKGKLEVTEQGVLFTGQAKTKGRECKPYIIPTLLPVERVMAAWNEVRRLKPGWSKMTSRSINGLVCLQVNRKTKALFQKFGLLHFKDLRAAYSSICYDKFAKHSTIQETKYFSTILGHTPKDNAVGLHYACFKVVSK